MPGSYILVGYGTDVLGMTRENTGYIGAVMWLGALFQFVSFFLTNRIGRKRALVSLVGASEMVAISLTLLIPVLFQTGRTWTYLSLLFVGGLCRNAVSPLFQTWLSDVIPSARRGRFLSARMFLLYGSTLVVQWLALGYLDREASFGPYAIVILVCTVCGATGYVQLLRAPMPETSQSSHFGLRDMVSAFRHNPFRRYVYFIAVVGAGFGLSVAYYAAFFREVLKLSFDQVRLYLLVFNVVKLLTIVPAGRIVDRFGMRLALRTMLVCYAVFYMGFPYFGKERMWFIVLCWALAGVGDGLFLVAVTSALFHALPKGRNRTAYLAVAQGGFVALLAACPFVTRGFLALAGDGSADLLGARFGAFQVVFFTSGLLMAGAQVFVGRMADTHDVRLGQIASAMLRGLPFRMWPRFWRPPWRRDG